MDSPGLGQGQLAGHRQCGDEPSGSGTTKLVCCMIGCYYFAV
jgi:hypothetical protein